MKWHGARLDILARFILALLQVRTVNLARLVPVFSSRAKTSSNDICLRRFFRTFTFEQSDIARTVAWLLPSDVPWVLTLDRTNWTLVGGAWVAALRAQQIPFRLRLKANGCIRRTRDGVEARTVQRLMRRTRPAPALGHLP